MKVRQLVLLPVIVLITSCVTHMPYKFSEGEKTASLKLVSGNSIAMCLDRTMYSLNKEPNQDVVKIPVGKRISIGTYLSYQGYNVIYSCYPFLSFKPEAGRTYITDATVVSNKCYIDLVKVDDQSVTSLTTEKSVGRRDCFASR